MAGIYYFPSWRGSGVIDVDLFSCPDKLRMLLVDYEYRLGKYVRTSVHGIRLRIR